MKTLNKLFEEKNAKLNVQTDAMNYASEGDLKKYLEITDKFISPEAKEVINYLIVNNKTYLSELATDDEENALAGFYNAGEPKTPELKELYKSLKKIVDDKKILEIPVFQTKQQFKSIINQEVSPDYVILDLENPKAQNELVKQYQPLLHKICRQYHGKSKFEYNDLMSYAQEGFLYAMRSFSKKTDENGDVDPNIVKYTFLQYAAQMVRFAILDAINHQSRIVRIPKSEITKIRKKDGQIAKDNTISGDKKMGINNSDDGNKTVFDFIDSQEYSDQTTDQSDLDTLWKDIYKVIIKEFGQKIFDIWCGFYGINGTEKLKNKELAQKYNVSNSSITYYCMKVNTFLQKDKKAFKMLQGVYELMKECLNEADRNDNRYDIHHLKISN